MSHDHFTEQELDRLGELWKEKTGPVASLVLRLIRTALYNLDNHREALEREGWVNYEPYKRKFF